MEKFFTVNAALSVNCSHIASLVPHTPALFLPFRARAVAVLVLKSERCNDVVRDNDSRISW